MRLYPTPIGPSMFAFFRFGAKTNANEHRDAQNENARTSRACH